MTPRDDLEEHTVARRTTTHVWDRTPVDVQARLRDLAGREQALSIAIAARGERKQRANQKESARDLEAELEQTRAEARTIRDTAGAGRIILHLTELSRREYRELVTAHPPRDGDDQDARTNFNGDTFPGGLIRATVTHAEDYLTGDPVHLDMDAWLSDDGEDAMGNADYFVVFTKAHGLHHEPTPQDPPVRAV